MTRQRMTYVLQGHLGEHISLDGRFLVVIVAPNPCPRHVCLMSVTELGKISTFEHAAGNMHCFPSV